MGVAKFSITPLPEIKNFNGQKSIETVQKLHLNPPNFDFTPPQTENSAGIFTFKIQCFQHTNENMRNVVNFIIFAFKHNFYAISLERHI